MLTRFPRDGVRMASSANIPFAPDVQSNSMSQRDMRISDGAFVFELFEHGCE
jgi:hypothetical protein